VEFLIKQKESMMIAELWTNVKNLMIIAYFAFIVPVSLFLMAIDIFDLFA
jgi:hypothetical protein